jgi:hypothetical protein
MTRPAAIQERQGFREIWPQVAACDFEVVHGSEDASP